jgi:hypothetical protein
MYPLANVMVASTKVCIRGRSDMEVVIKYKNVPFFCFICGRIGHPDKECLEGDMGVGEVSFGVELRPSPPKRLCEVKVQAMSVAACFMNFEGLQRAKLQDEASWPSNVHNREAPKHDSGLPGEEEEVSKPIPYEEECELMQGVKHIDMKEGNISSGLPLVFGLDGVQQRVSFGTNVASEEELSSGISCPIGSLGKQPKTGRVSDLPHVESEMELAKHSDPNRSKDKAKRKRSSPYKRLKRCAKELSKKEQAQGDAGGVIKSEDQVMLDGALGASTLAMFSC